MVVFCNYNTDHEANILLKNELQHRCIQYKKNYKALKLNNNPTKNYVELLKYLKMNKKNKSN